MTYETKTTIFGWTAVAALALFTVFAFTFHKPYVPPPASYWPTEPYTVNTAQIVRMERAGVDGTRIWFSKTPMLFTEQPEFFEGPTRIVTATRIREWNQ